MDECSSNLWQLNDVNKLEHLVETLSSMCPLDSETWIAAGNLESLKKRHQKAVSFFKRARYIDPFNPYPHTLISQELHITDGNFQESVLKGVIHMDSFHYQAWYFLGRIKAQQQKFDEALTYLRYSSDINPRNTVILSLIAYCFLKNKKYKNSLEIIQKAIDIDSENLLLKFECATIFFEMNNFRECLKNLEPLLKACRFDCGVNLLAAKTYYALEMLPESVESASKIINQNKANPFAELEAKELLKSIGLYQNSQSSRINNLPTSPIMNEIAEISQNSNLF
uniref:Cell division cycle protein 27 homolog n=1 Tax=Myxobolus squamalis TaxID=59785 RepID=A0A6B2G4H3_MYXSQ